ncbi:nitrate/sulfonate/bicarbonate ABC transporter ATP-binding protein [Superficieibacter electus]|uniref:Nitrate/sulfonate/bicarbonate ABC transporter ATP-binding protein n=1 Tax=Superficieibacter electus TaxID=2022662 RepID=A0A2P5GUF9_9ENTR|nr:ABC transporter ATP-binding protein [Superficieibacter electus]POP47345.1 nitrate/sulfonate/bicarbonate ABC transporter ATP-binding protein [Superficieibacter electus]POP50192.1 nitrate/sulfonate/bicarbonate ABC transporter ATP-binding protein [Superficieibacter electus]
MSALLNELPAPAAPVIDLAGVSKQFDGQTVLHDISLQVWPGEIVALLGASGGGKSTLLNIISGLLPADAGTITLQGEDLSRFSQWRQVAYLFQEDRLLPWRTVRQNVSFALENTALGRRERLQRVDTALHLVGMEKVAAKWPHQLSGGMRSRIALARSLVAEPQILLMDEPFSRLDPQTRSAMHAELLRICALKKMTVVIVTHDVEEAVILADRIVILQPNPGRIKQSVALTLPRPRLPTGRDVAEKVRLLRLEV